VLGKSWLEDSIGESPAGGTREGGGTMSFKAYLDNIKAKTGKTPEDFSRLAKAKGLLEPGVKTGQIVDWLKQDFGLQRGHAMAIVLTLKSATEPKVTGDDRVARHFTGDRARWRTPFDGLLLKARSFGPGVSVGPTASYLSILRHGKKFAIVQVTGERLDVGLKLKGVAPTSRLEPAGTWNSMVSPRARLTEPKQIDKELLARLKEAFDRA
jgi:hypothetical protein